MRPAWLIEAGVYGSEADPLVTEIRRQGMAAEIVPFRTLQKEKDLLVGGRDLRTLSVTARTSLYTVPMEATGHLFAVPRPKYSVPFSRRVDTIE